MTVPSTKFREDYAGNGSATSFPYAFRIFKAADLVVTKTDSSGNETTLTLGTDYTVTGAGSYNGGAVVLTTALPTNYRLTIERVLAIRQDTDLRNQGEFLAEAHEDAFDRLTMIMQNMAGYLGMGQSGTQRALLLGNTDIDGLGAYDVRNNRIKNLADPIDDQDSVTKLWALNTISDSMTDGSGNAVLQLLSSSDINKGASLVSGAVQVVADVSTLKSIAPTLSRCIQTLGYYDRGDGGGWLFHGKIGNEPGTYVDNGGSVIVPTGGDGSSAWVAVVKGSVRFSQFGAVGNGIANDTNPIKNALLSLGYNGGRAYGDKARYRVTEQINFQSYISVVGTGQFGGNAINNQGATTIYGDHSGNAVVSLAGSIACHLSDICIQTGNDSEDYPQVGLLLGRTTSASAGYHKIIRTSVYGKYHIAPVFSVASEDNYWEDLHIWLYGGGAKYCLYTSIGNSFESLTQPLYTSSNLDNVFNKFWFANSSEDADSSCIYIDGAEAVGSWSFYGGYLTPFAGSYVTIANGYVDATSMLGPITFVGVSGERLSGGDPLYGFKLTADSAQTLHDLTIIGCRFDFLAGSNHYQIWQSPNLTLSNPNINIKPPEAYPYAQTVLRRAKILGGTVNVGRYAAWKDATLLSGWVNSFGSPYPSAAFSMDSSGYVSFRGTVTGGSGIIFTLPEDYRPPRTLRFPTVSDGAVALVSVNTSGNVTLTSGTAGSVELGGIRFNLAEWEVS